MNKKNNKIRMIINNFFLLMFHFDLICLRFGGYHNIVFSQMKKTRKLIIDLSKLG